MVLNRLITETLDVDVSMLFKFLNDPEAHFSLWGIGKDFVKISPKAFEITLAFKYFPYRVRFEITSEEKRELKVVRYSGVGINKALSIRIEVKLSKVNNKTYMEYSLMLKAGFTPEIRLDPEIKEIINRIRGNIARQALEWASAKALIRVPPAVVAPKEFLKGIKPSEVKGAIFNLPISADIDKLSSETFSVEKLATLLMTGKFVRVRRIGRGKALDLRGVIKDLKTEAPLLISLTCGSYIYRLMVLGGQVISVMLEANGTTYYGNEAIKKLDEFMKVECNEYVIRVYEVST